MLPIGKKKKEVAERITLGKMLEARKPALGERAAQRRTEVRKRGDNDRGREGSCSAAVVSQDERRRTDCPVKSLRVCVCLCVQHLAEAAMRNGN